MVTHLLLYTVQMCNRFFETDFIILLFREGCEHGLEFIRMVEEQFPNARFEKETSQEGELIICKYTT